MPDTAIKTTQIEMKPKAIFNRKVMKYAPNISGESIQDRPESLSRRRRKGEVARVGIIISSL
jgi:hypothetical protein